MSQALANTIVVERDALLPAMTHLQKVGDRKSTSPILSHVLISPQPQGSIVRLTATDNDIAVEADVRCDLSEGSAEAFTVDCTSLYDILRALSAGAQVSLALQPDGKSVEIRSGRARYRLPVLPGDAFPRFVEHELTHRFPLLAGDLVRLFGSVSFAQCTDPTRFYLNGTFVDGSSGRLRFIATDGHRLACDAIDRPAGCGDMPGVIVPAKTVGLIETILGGVESTQEVAVAISDKRIRLSIGSITLTSRLIDGSYPDCERFFALASDKEATVDRDGLAAIIERVKPIEDGSGRLIRVSLSAGRIALATRGSSGEIAEDEADIEYDAAPMEIGFNHRYLSDILDHIQADTATLSLLGSGDPVTIRPVPPASRLYVLLPMRV